MKDRTLCLCVFSLFLLLVPACGGGEDGFSPETRAALQQTMDDYLVSSGGIGTAIAVSKGNKFWQGTAGLANLQEQVTLQSDTTFRIGSVTKLLTAIVVMQLVDEGLVSLEAPLGRYVHGYPRWMGITIRHLLQMRSGIPGYLSDPVFLAGVVTKKRSYKPSQLLSRVKDHSLAFPPGEDCKYTSSGYILLGMVAEEVTGKSIEDLIHERIAVPLGLDHTVLETEDEIRDELAHGYTDFDRTPSGKNLPDLLMFAMIRANRVEKGLVDSTYYLHPSTTWAAGAAVSNVREMVVMIRELFRGTLLSEKSLEQMTDTHPCTIIRTPVECGLGLHRFDSVAGFAYGHGGLYPGYLTHTVYLPEKDIAFSQISNYLPEGQNILMNEVLEIIEQDTSAY